MTARVGWSVEDVTGEAFGSFERFYRSEYRAVLAFAHVLTGDPGRAEEVTQEAFLAAYGSWAELDSPAAWTRRVASNKAKSWWRRQYAERRAVGRLAASSDQVTEMPADTAAFWREVRRLSRNQAVALVLFYLEDRSAAEIAEILGCAESTARVHLSRGRAVLAKRLGVDS
jgi:RNA polymerase sigma-70 factor (ECF subfamily)